MSQSFHQVADTVASQLTELLRTTVLVSDGRATVVARRQFGGVTWRETLRSGGRYLRFPIQICDQTGEVLVEQLCDAETISPRIAQAFIDLIVTREMDQEPLPEAARQQTLKNRLIQNLLRGQQSTAPETLDQAKQLGLDLAPPRAVVLIDASIFVGSRYAQQRSQQVIDSLVSFFHLPDDTICADLGEGQFVVLKASNSKNMQPWAKQDIAAVEPATASWTNLDALSRAGTALAERLQAETSTPISVGIGRYHPGALGLSRSYQDAQMALRLGRQFAAGQRVYCLDRLGIAAFACVADERTKIELALHLISPLDNEPDLMQTLQVFFERDCGLSATAKQLTIHRNTLTYRLEKIASLTGLDPRRFDDAVQIRLALLLRSLKPQTTL